MTNNWSLQKTTFLCSEKIQNVELSGFFKPFIIVDHNFWPFSYNFYYKALWAEEHGIITLCLRKHSIYNQNLNVYLKYIFVFSNFFSSILYQSIINIGSICLVKKLITIRLVLPSVQTQFSIFQHQYMVKLVEIITFQIIHIYFSRVRLRKCSNTKIKHLKTWINYRPEQ